MAKIKQTSAVIVLFGLIAASLFTGFGSYCSMRNLVNEDMDRALALTLEEQQSNVISADTIRTFNQHLQIAELRGKATLAVDTRGLEFRAYAHCSEATIFSLSDQRPATILWLLTGFWAIFLWYRRHQTKAKAPLCLSPASGSSPLPSSFGNTYGGLTYSELDSCFYADDGCQVQLTPMQHQLMQMFFLSPSHSLTKTEICNALWPKKPDASDTLYTLIRRLKPIVERHSNLRIASDRRKSYRLMAK
jgi:hypothetical protein